MSKKITLVEMGLRDGLQNEKVILSADQRVDLALQLIDAGVKRLEVGAFVSPKWVPQMANSDLVLRQLVDLRRRKKIKSDVQFSALVPNLKGLELALNEGADEVAFFTAASETFSLKNTNCTIAESFSRLAEMMKIAKKHKIPVRGYLSTCFGCPFEGDIDPRKVIALTGELLKHGVYEVSLGDTIGVAQAGQVVRLLKKIKTKYSFKKIALHFHDTRGQALANTYAALLLGVRTFDSSVGGLGGCPYAPGAMGNVATEDVLYMLESLGFETDVDLDALIKLKPKIENLVKHPIPSRLAQAGRLVPRL